MAELLQEISEADATGAVKILYDDIQRTLQVSTVPWLFRVLSTHAQCSTLLWETLKPTITNQFESSADGIRVRAVSSALQVFTGSDHLTKLKGSGYSAEKIQGQLLVYHYMNPKLLLLTTVLKEALEERPVRVKSIVVTPTGRGVLPGMPKVKMIGTAGGKISEIFSSIQETLDLPGVSDEFRTLAQWPDYLELAWGELRPIVQQPSYARLVEETRQSAHQEVQELRRRVDLGPEDLRAMGISDAEQSDIKNKVDIFYRVYLKMVVPVAYWTLALAGLEEAKLSGEDLLRQWAVPKK